MCGGGGGGAWGVREGGDVFTSWTVLVSMTKLALLNCNTLMDNCRSALSEYFSVSMLLHLHKIHQAY